MASATLIANSLVFVAPLVINTSSLQQIINRKHSQKRARTHETKALSKLSFHAKTIYLFLKSDLKTVVLPWTLFGLSHAIAAPILDAPTSASTRSIFARIPLAVFWLTINLLAGAIGNQSSTTAIIEDRLNKPWRPIAAERITPEAAKRLMLACNIIALLCSRYTGGVAQCLIIAAMAQAYNNLGAGDRSWALRGLMCGVGYITFGTGAMEVMLGAEKAYSGLMLQWFALLVIVIAAGVHAADIYDQEGDQMVGRDTLPLAIGDLLSRCVLAIAIFIPSFLCPWFCGCSVAAYIMFWNLWLVVIYCLPLVNFLSS